MEWVSKTNSLDLIGFKTKKLNILEISDNNQLFEGRQC